MTKINLSPIKDKTSFEFESICQHNPDLILELSAEGELIVMSPTGGETGSQNANLVGLFFVWNEINKQGILFDSSTCFKLPLGGQRSPDLSWIALEKWNSLTPEQKKRFPPIAPDFVLELISPTDVLIETQDKMKEYLNAGVRLGWLINPEVKTVEIYRLGSQKEVLINPVSLSGEDVLPGLVIDLKRIWG